MFRTLKLLMALVLMEFALGLSFACARDLTVGVAANFMLPFEELSRVFGERTGIRVRATFTSTGNLYAQIRNGAPYELFIAADETRPDLLHKEGLGARPFVYAKGRVVLWSAKKELMGLGSWQAAIASASLGRVAVANPETAPYGAAACEALKRAGLWDAAKPKLVFAQTVAQAFQFAHTLSADAGFCALSAVYSVHGKRGRHWSVPQAPEIVQAACVLDRAKDDPAVMELAAFLVSEEARAIKGKFGYE